MYFWCCHKWSQRGYVFGLAGGNDSHQGVLLKHSRDVGAYPPPHVAMRGDSLRPLLRRGAVSPNDVPEQKKGKGVRARQGLRAPCQSVMIEFEAG